MRSSWWQGLLWGTVRRPEQIETRDMWCPRKAVAVTMVIADWSAIYWEGEGAKGFVNRLDVNKERETGIKDDSG